MVKVIEKDGSLPGIKVDQGPSSRAFCHQ